MIRARRQGVVRVVELLLGEPVAGVDKQDGSVFAHLREPGFKLLLHTGRVKAAEKGAFRHHSGYKKVDGGFEVLGVSEAAALSFDAHDFAVDSLGDAVVDSVRAIAETGVDIISIGALTHSPRAMDISMLLD